MLVVRKHRAPKGALRLLAQGAEEVSDEGQKAPSAKRCIKTAPDRRARVRDLPGSESTERQKVH